MRDLIENYKNTILIFFLPSRSQHSIKNIFYRIIKKEYISKIIYISDKNLLNEHNLISFK
jgi:hypothetical protein